MKFKQKQKKFDAVEMMRKIRDSLSNRYADHPEIEEKELQEIRKKYHIKVRDTEQADS